MRSMRPLLVALCAALLLPGAAHAIMMDFNTPGQLGTMSAWPGPTFSHFSEDATGGVGGSGGLHMSAPGGVVAEIGVLNSGGLGVITDFGLGESVSMSLDFQLHDTNANSIAGLVLFGDAGIQTDNSILYAFSTSGTMNFWVTSDTQNSTFHSTASSSDWYRMAISYTNNGTDITASAGLYGIGADGTGGPSEIFSLDFTFDNDTLETTGFLMSGVLGWIDAGAGAAIDFDNAGFVTGTSSPMPVSTPEPGSIALMGLGMAGLFMVGGPRRER